MVTLRHINLITQPIIPLKSLNTHRTKQHTQLQRSKVCLLLQQSFAVSTNQHAPDYWKHQLTKSVKCQLSESPM